MPNRITGLLIAHSEIHQVDVSLRADRAANAVEREAGSVYTDLRRLLTSGESLTVVHQRARRLFHGLPERLNKKLEGQLRGIATWSARQTGRILKTTLPTDYLRAVAIQKLTGRESIHEGVHLLHDLSPGVLRAGKLARGSARRNVPRLSLTEDDRASETTGVIQLVLRALGLYPTDYADPLREPARAELSDQKQRQLFQRLLFPPPPEEWVRQVLGLTLQKQTWYQAMNGATRAAQFGPDRLADVIATGYALGDSQADIIDKVKPFVDGLKWRAARVARTFGLAVAGEAQRQMHQQIDHLTIGFQIRATLDERTRPAHRLRNGTVYYKQPKAGQLGLDQMPRPPIEADGSLSWN